MNIMELGAIGELVGGVAVIASLIYLAAQIRQNTRTLRTTVHDAQTAGHSEYLIDVARDPILAPIVAVLDWWATEITFRDDFSRYVNARIEAGPRGGFRAQGGPT